ncbi:MAG: helix-hairpin-helix domain-containing protein [Clostridia bacterium]|nr:helix-hairpin-helix domain-containing protein [Clostridia bacterium]
MEVRIKDKSYKICWEYIVAPLLFLIAILVLLLSSHTFSKETCISLERRPQATVVSSPHGSQEVDKQPSSKTEENLSQRGAPAKEGAVENQGEKSQQSVKSTASADAPKDKQQAIVNINSAGVQELMTLPYIGEVKAKAIVAYREAHGPFKRAEDLLNIKGIGPKTLEKLRPFIAL